MKKIGLLYFGRLEKEKWFDAIIEMINIFAQAWKELPFELFVFWEGTYKKQLVELTTKHSEIHYFGRQNLETIKRYVPNCSYCLMPSTFLETFWLTALTAVSRWLPVIGFAKGGLASFIAPELDLTLLYEKSTAQKLHHLIEKLSKEESVLTIEKDIHKKYSLENRKENIKKLFVPLDKGGREAGGFVKILLVTDFTNKIWWIETYVHDVQMVLQSMWYEVKIFWWKLPDWIIGKFAKYLWIFAWIFNFYEAIRLYFVIKKFKPDLIRYHSILRYLGWMSVRVSKFFPAKKWMMYHDFWYVHPFPHALTHIHQIHTPLNFKNYLKWAHSILAKIFSAGKYLSVFLIRNTLKKHIDIHLVPSDFMIDIIQKSYKISPEKIQTLSHFIQE